jgi:hypothetical protein
MPSNKEGASMSESRTKTVATIISVIALLLTVVSITFAMTAGSVIQKEEVSEQRIQRLEISDGGKNVEIESMKNTLNKMEESMTKKLDKIETLILSHMGK